MGITNSNKELNKDHIDCGETFKVTLSLTAEAEYCQQSGGHRTDSGPFPEHGGQSNRQPEKRSEKVHPDHR